MEPALQTWDLGKRYDRRTVALAGLSLSVPTGTITALVGPNGAGKSTLIKAWVGFERPTTGRVAVAGIDPWHTRSEALDRIGYVPQTPALYREFTVADHLDLARTLQPRFDRAVAARRLEELVIPLDALAGRLSGGQQAQVGLALALGTRADVLLLDEPLASLDPLARREFLHVLTDAVRSDGSTALLASHVITDVEQACDHLLVLGGGRLLLDETIPAAVAGHRIAEPGAARPLTDVVPVGTFMGPTGDPLSLVRLVEPEPTGLSSLRQATLEEVVLGYLAAGRSVPDHAATSVERH